MIEHEEKHIAIIGLGPSSAEYLNLIKQAGGRSNFADEVWTINAMGDSLACDMVVHMDDVRIQEIRAAARPESNIAAMLKWLKTTKTPVLTSRAHPDYPALFEFPLEEILNSNGAIYFNNTAAYAVAYAIHVGATRISLFGMDYTYENTHHAEKGRACVEFWLGKAHSYGIEISTPKVTTLLDSNLTDAQRCYGYDTQLVEFKLDEDGLMRLEFTERESLPSAEDIEAAYNHAAPINEQHVIKGK